MILPLLALLLLQEQRRVPGNASNRGLHPMKELEVLIAKVEIEG